MLGGMGVGVVRRGSGMRFLINSMVSNWKFWIDAVGFP